MFRLLNLSVHSKPFLLEFLKQLRPIEVRLLREANHTAPTTGACQLRMYFKLHTSRHYLVYLVRTYAKLLQVLLVHRHVVPHRILVHYRVLNQLNQLACDIAYRIDQLIELLRVLCLKLSYFSD